MKLLVAIANYGTKNVQYAERLIREYRSMPFDVDIYVLSESPKDYGVDVKVLVGLPSSDPWSLPFAHKKLFADNAEKYDLFIYAEDDILIRAQNILAFLRASDAIGGDFLAGFMRYEVDPAGRKNYPDIYSHYHWVPGSVRRVGAYAFARFSNDHAACYMLTRRQLRNALSSGGFLVPPHSGRYDLICSAGTDPYTQCGFRRVVCFSHLEQFEVHHLSNIYVNRVGLDEDRLRLQIAALWDIADGKRSADELLTTEKPISTSMWDKSYYEPARHDLAALLPPSAAEVLSVGAGWGETEALVRDSGARVTAIPLDSVIATLVETRDIRVLAPGFDEAANQLDGQAFDAILLPDTLQHVREPARLLSELRARIRPGGRVVGSVPNLGWGRRLAGRAVTRDRKFDDIDQHFDDTCLHMTTPVLIRHWLTNAGFAPIELQYRDPVSSARWSSWIPWAPKAIATRTILFAAAPRA